MVVSERVEWPSPHSFIYSSLRFTPRSREVQLVELETTTPTLSHLPLVAHIPLSHWNTCRFQPHSKINWASWGDVQASIELTISSYHLQCDLSSWFFTASAFLQWHYLIAKLSRVLLCWSGLSYAEAGKLALQLLWKVYFRSDGTLPYHT